LGGKEDIKEKCVWFSSTSFAYSLQEISNFLENLDEGVSLTPELEPGKNIQQLSVRLWGW
jgi:hypothetical protein